MSRPAERRRAAPSGARAQRGARALVGPLLLGGALALASTLAACASAGPKAGAEAAKSPAPTEGQIQEQYIAKRDEGRRLLEQRRFGGSLDAFLAALRIRNGSADALLGIGRSYAGLEYYEKAKEYFDRYLDLEKDRDPATYQSIALVYGYNLGLYEAGIRLLTKALDAGGKPGWTSYHRGVFYQRTNRKAEAAADLGRALEAGQRERDQRLVAQASEAAARLAN